MSALSAPIAVGLVGAGPWAEMVHAPTLAAGPETRLAGVWARRPEAAAALAGRHGTVAFDRLDALYDACEAVAFAVPPGVQAELALGAAQAGKHLLLEKPIADDLAAAERLADGIGSAGVASVVVLSWRYADPVRRFLADVSKLRPIGGEARFLSSAFLGGPFQTPWRLQRGALLDLGPHVLDLLEAALGPITEIHADGALGAWISLLCRHDSGVTSTAALSATTAIDPHRAGVAVFAEEGVTEIDCVAAVTPDAFARLRREFAEAVRSGGHPLDVRRGLQLQRLLDDAERQLRRR